MKLHDWLTVVSILVGFAGVYQTAADVYSAGDRLSRFKAAGRVVFASAADWMSISEAAVVTTTYVPTLDERVARLEANVEALRAEMVQRDERVVSALSAEIRHTAGAIQSTFAGDVEKLKSFVIEGTPGRLSSYRGPVVVSVGLLFAAGAEIASLAGN